MLEKKDSGSSGVLSGSHGCGSRSLDEEEPAGASAHVALLPTVSSDDESSHKLEPRDPEEPEPPAWECCSGSDATGSTPRTSYHGEHLSTDTEDEEPETTVLLENPPPQPSSQPSPPPPPAPSWPATIPCILTPSHQPRTSSPTEITLFDESGEKCCIHLNDNSQQNSSNLAAQESGSQMLFPMDALMILDGTETPSAMSRVASACSTVALERDEEEETVDGERGPHDIHGFQGLQGPQLTQLEQQASRSALVVGSAPATTLGGSRGILQTTKLNRKNSQVCFREEQDQDGCVTPLLPGTNKGGGGSIRSATCSDGAASDDAEYDLEPPDGGWGWLVLAGSILVNILVPGFVKSFGVLFVEFLEVFDATPVAASWIPALCYFLYSSLGPVASVLSAKFSYRTVTFLGGGFAALGMVVSYFATSIVYLYISFGVLVGTGAGLAFPPGVFIVSSYFQRLRGLANGLCISGSAIGSMILPPLLRHLLETYGYRGAVLIMGGITCNVWVGAMFYHPVERHMKKVRREVPRTPKPEDELQHSPALESRPVVIQQSPVKNSLPQVAMSQPITIPSNEQPLRDPRDIMFYFGEGSPEQDPDYEKRWLAAQSSSFIGPNIDKASLEKSPSPLALRDAMETNQQIMSGSSSDKKGWDVFSTLPASTQRVLRLSLRPQQSQAVAAALQHQGQGQGQGHSQSTSQVQGQLSRSFSSNVSLSSFRYISTVHHGSTLAALQQNPPDKEFASTLSLRSVSHSCWESALDCARGLCCKRCTGKDKKEPSSPSKKASKLTENNNDRVDLDDKSDSSSKLLDLSLLKDSLYLVILLSNSTNAIGYTNFIILLPAYAISLGFDKSSASLLLSLVAAFDLVGRIGGSALSDLQFVPRKYYYIAGLAISGAILAFVPLLATFGYTSLAISCAIFGLGSGTYVGVTAVLMADMLGAERLASSFGMSLFVNGVLQLLGPPLCGLALQQLQSYGPIFSTLGVVLLLGAAMWGFIPLIERKRREQQSAPRQLV